MQGMVDLIPGTQASKGVGVARATTRLEPVRTTRAAADTLCRALSFSAVRSNHSLLSAVSCVDVQTALEYNCLAARGLLTGTVRPSVTRHRMTMMAAALGDDSVPAAAQVRLSAVKELVPQPKASTSTRHNCNLPLAASLQGIATQLGSKYNSKFTHS